MAAVTRVIVIQTMESTTLQIPLVFAEDAIIPLPLVEQLDNSQNIMDYGNCEMMFTQGQMNWAEAALNSSVAQRNNLWSQTNLVATGTDSLSYAIASCPPTADFGVNKTKSCEGETFNFSNKSFHAFADKNSFIYNWTFSGGSIQNSSLKRPYGNL